MRMLWYIVCLYVHVKITETIFPYDVGFSGSCFHFALMVLISSICAACTLHPVDMKPNKLNMVSFGEKVTLKDNFIVRSQ